MHCYSNEQLNYSDTFALHVFAENVKHLVLIALSINKLEKLIR